MKTLDEQIEYMLFQIEYEKDRDYLNNLETCQAILKTLEESRELREHRETTET